MTINAFSESNVTGVSREALPDFALQQGIRISRTAHNPAWQFDVFNDHWQLGTKDYVNLKWMAELSAPTHIWFSLRLLFAAVAESKSSKTTQAYLHAFSMLSNWDSANSFQKSFHELTKSYHKKIKQCFSILSNEDHELTSELRPLRKNLIDIINWLNTQKHAQNSNKSDFVFDPKKGIYSDEELQEIHYKLRTALSNKLNILKEDSIMSFPQFNSLSVLIACVLMITINRRPVQLAMLKWSDVLPIGLSFKDHRFSGRSPAPEQELEFSDADELHLRTFKAKAGFQFRQHAEYRSHRLEMEFSRLILIYRKQFQTRLLESLEQQDIALNPDETQEIMARCPLFPEKRLFTTNYKTKSALFNTLGHVSDVMHRDAGLLRGVIALQSEKLNLISSRVGEFNITNNRSRHTTITNGVEQGLSVEQLAALTGVTVEAVTQYMHLDFKERIQIDERMAGVRIFKQFAMHSIEELKNSEEFTITNEFGEPQGLIHKKSNCLTCVASMGKPIGCYGCSNFQAFKEADHKANLDIVNRKIEFNKDADKVTLNKMYRAQLYIKATIAVIDSIVNGKRGLSNVN